MRQLEISTGLTPTHNPVAFTNIFDVAFGNPSNQFSTQRDILSVHLSSSAAALFEVICLNAIVVFKDPLERNSFVKGLMFPIFCQQMTYAHGNHLGNLHFYAQIL